MGFITSAFVCCLFKSPVACQSRCQISNHFLFSSLYKRHICIYVVVASKRITSAWGLLVSVLHGKNAWKNLFCLTIFFLTVSLLSCLKSGNPWVPLLSWSWTLLSGNGVESNISVQLSLYFSLFTTGCPFEHPQIFVFLIFFFFIHSNTSHNITNIY